MHSKKSKTGLKSIDNDALNKQKITIVDSDSHVLLTIELIYSGHTERMSSIICLQVQISLTVEMHVLKKKLPSVKSRRHKFKWEV